MTALLNASFLRDLRGVIAVEMALLAPVLLAIMLAAYEGANAINAQLAIQRAALIASQNAMAQGANGSNMTPVIQAAKAALPPEWSSATDANLRPQVAASVACECSVTGAVACSVSCASGETKKTFLTVTISRSHPLLIKMTGLPDRIALSDKAVVRLE